MASGDLAFEPITRETVSSQIRSQLLRRVTTGELAPGVRMPSERDLAEQFRVARTSVREAIQALVSLGVIERRGNRTFVAEHLPEIEVGHGDDRKGFVQELFETRLVLESPIFQLAAERANSDTRAAVAALSERFDPEMGIEEFRRLDREFHTTIASGCENPLLIELYGKVLDRLFHSKAFDSLLSDNTNRSQVRAIVAESVKAHTKMAAAFAAADPDAMHAASRAHVSAVQHRMIEKLV